MDTALEHNLKPRGPFLALQGIVVYCRVLQLSIQKSFNYFIKPAASEEWILAAKWWCLVSKGKVDMVTMMDNKSKQ